jgi:hypothetical protein
MAKGRGPSGDGREEIEALFEEILVDAYGDDEQHWAFRQAFEDEVALPADAFVIGEPVSVVAIDYDGDTRRGLTATCRREDGTRHSVAASGIGFPAGSAGARYIAVYRRWLGLGPFPRAGAAAPRKSGRTRRPKRIST